MLTHRGGRLCDTLTKSSTIESVMAQTRALGISPNETLASAIAQAFYAARMPLPNGG